jgi:RNA polymerase sigma-70 factor (ECF subfamily)
MMGAAPPVNLGGEPAYGMTTTGPFDALSDEALMRLVQDDRQDAFAALMRRYEGPVYNFLRRMAGSPDDAADLYQETFLRVYAHRRRYQGGRPFRPWLYRIAANLASDRNRKRRRRPTVALEARPGHAARDVANGHSGPAERAAEREMADALAAAVASLPEKHRAVFLMARYQGMPYADIATALRIPVGTVKSRMNHAVKRLLADLGDWLP